MSGTECDDLLSKLCCPGEVIPLPYPGIGFPPRIPGGDIIYTGREQFQELVDVVSDTSRANGGGDVVYVTGTKGVGKSCFLRGLAWALVSAQERVVCLWSLAAAYSNLSAELKNALRFSYCQQRDTLEKIDSLQSLQDVEKFMVDSGERIYLIVDGVEALDSGVPTSDSKADLFLQELVKVAHVTVFGVSRTAVNSRKRKADACFVSFEQGFWKGEYDAYTGQVSLLGKLTCWQDDIDYFAAQHPLSLSVLDASCRQWAKKRRVTKPFGPAEETSISDDEIAVLLEDFGEWEEALKLFVSSAEMSSMRVLLQETMRGLKSSHHSLYSMMARDRTFVLGDPTNDIAEYATPYIRRVHIEEFREAENKSVYKGDAWYAYCRYLLDEMSCWVNWPEMGWLCENLAAEVVSSKGMALDGLHIPGMRTQRFGAVPSYRTWITEVSVGNPIYFVPLKYNYRYIDGLVVWKDATGGFHLIAIQVTVNPEKHLASASDFMSFNSITDWIPKEKLEEWKLHLVFLCLKDRPSEHVKDDRKTTRSGITYGTVGYEMHALSLSKAFGETVGATLEEIANLRYKASQPRAEEEVQAEAKAIDDAFAAAVAAGQVKGRAAAAVKALLSRSEFTKAMLEGIARKHDIAVRGTKPEIVVQLATGLLEL